MFLHCAVCGRNEKEVKLLTRRNICVDCYIPTIKYDRLFEFRFCKRCDKVYLGRWVKRNFFEMKDYAREKMKAGENRVVDVDLEKKLILIDIGVEKVWLDVDFVYRQTICEDCSKKAGGYYEAIIQLRGEREQVEKYLEKIKKTISKDSFVSKIEEIHGGYDIYVGSKDVAFNVLTKYELKAKRSRTLAGVKEGKKIYRHTFAVRLE